MADAEDLLRRIQASRQGPSEGTAQQIAPAGDAAPAATGAAPTADSLWQRLQAHKEVDTSAGAGLWEGLKRGVQQVGEGGAQIGARMMAAGPEEGAGAFDVPSQRQAMPGRVDQAVQQSADAYRDNPARMAHPNWAMGGQLAGNVAASSLLSPPIPGFGPGVGGLAAGAKGLLSGISGAAGRSAAGLIGGGAARGAGAAAMMPVAPGGDYWDEKLKQVEFGTAAGAALPAAGAAIAPRLPNPSVIAQGVSRAFRPLYNFMTGAEERTGPGFERTIARQVLDPIGGQVAGRVSGHELVNETEKQISAAYDRVLPNVTFPKAAAERANPELDNFVATMSEDHVRRYNELMKRQVDSRFGDAGVMDGATFKRVQSDLGKRARSWIGTNDDELGRAVLQRLDGLNQGLADANPQFAPELKRVNEAFRMFVPMRMAAGKSRSMGQFTPDDFLDALGRGDKGKILMSRGDAPLQGYAEVAKAAMGSKPTGLWDLLQIFHHVGLPAQVMSGAAQPLGRRAKDISPAVAPLAGAVAGDVADEGEKPKRRDPYVSSSGL